MSRSTRRILYAIAAPLLLVAGCRGVVGIHDLDVIADGGAGGGEGGTDAGADVIVGVDARADAPMPTIDAGCQLSTGMACGMCCRTATVLRQAFGKLDSLAKQEGCVCGSGSCSSECGTTVCAGSPSNGMCGGCVDMSIHPMQPATATAECISAETACSNDSVCTNAIACQHSCNP